MAETLTPVESRASGKVPANSLTVSHRAIVDLSRLYEEDEPAWLDEMVRLIEAKRLDKLDYAHLKEYLDDMARRDRKEVKNRVVQLMLHLLKWAYQPRKRTRSWEISITKQRDELGDEFSSKTLRNYVGENLDEFYSKAVKYVALETGMDTEEFPKKCPFTAEYLLGKELPSKKNL